MTSVWTRARIRARGERGQALVEFALIAPLFLMLVVGVIQFAVAINFWFDLNRLANQGARSAAVNCGPAAANQCGPTTLAKYLGPKTASTPYGQMISKGNDLFGGNDSTAAPANPYGYQSAEICYVPPSDPAPAGWKPKAGDAVRVTLRNRYRLQAIVRLAKIDLTAKATMRLEQQPNNGSSTGPLPDPNNSANYVLVAHVGTDACQP